MSIYKSGQRVTIFRQPYTHQDSEGVAVLLRRVGPKPIDGVEQWLVHFEGDPDGETYQRTLVPEIGVTH